MKNVITPIPRAICLTSLLVCCAWATTATRTNSAEPIKIGAVLPFSGGVELYGRQAKLGLDLAVKEINAGGGILGRPVEVIYEDDKTDPAVAVEATRKLIERDGVLAVVGPITSRNLDAIAPVVESLKTPLLYATNYEGGKCSRYVFSFSTVPNQELAQLLPYMNRTFGNTYFLLGADRAWPHKMFEAAEPIIRKLGGRVVGKEFTTGKETDFAPLIARIAATKAKVLLFALKGDGLNFIPQADDRGLLKTTTVAFLGLSETDLGVFGGKGQNMFVVVPFVATSDVPSVKAFVAKVKADAGAERHGVELRDDALQRADRDEGGDRKGRQGRQGSDDRCARRADDQITDRAGDDRQKSSRDHEHVPGQDARDATSSPYAHSERSRPSPDANDPIRAGTIAGVKRSGVGARAVEALRLARAAAVRRRDRSRWPPASRSHSSMLVVGADRRNGPVRN